MTERDRWGVRGSVQTCRIQRTWYSRRCGADACEAEERGDITFVEFRADGSLAQRSHRNPDASEWTTTYTYGDTGRLATVRTENNGVIFDLQLFEYDTSGRLLRVIVRPTDRGDRLAESYEYDGAGRKKKTFFVDLAAQRPDTQYSWGVEGTDSYYSAPGAATLTTLYNEHEQPIDLMFRDEEGRLLSRVEFGYEGGHLVEEAQTVIADTFPPEMLTSMNLAQRETMLALLGANDEPIRRLRRYDDQGRRAETRSRMGPLGGDRKTVVYNDQGDPIKEVFEHDEREYGIDEEGQLSGSPTTQSTNRSEARLRYDHDAHGNWLTKTVESRGGTDQDFSLSSVERRTLTYFS
jgi:hypothetical protein